MKLSKKLHCFDLRSNEWHIALLQIYETLFKMEVDRRNERGQVKFDWEGNLIETADKSKREKNPTLCSAMKPLLEHIDSYR